MQMEFGFFILLTLTIVLCGDLVEANINNDKDTNPFIAAGCKTPLVSGLYVFGDSTVDPGNNNGLPTIIRADHAPYGQNFPTHTPTGRFTDGLLITDILSSAMGLKPLLPAYLDPKFTGESLLTGASFASSGSGYYIETSINFNVLPIEGQLDLFRKYKTRLRDMVGQENATRIVNSAGFAISTGADDFLLNYYFNPLTRKRFSIPRFQSLLLHGLSKFIKDVHREGGKQIVVIGIPPFGCLPIAITVGSGNLIDRKCVEEPNQVAKATNTMIQKLVQTMQSNFRDSSLIYVDLYNVVLQVVQNPTAYGFTESRRGCCGTGFLEAGVPCNNLSSVCSSPSTYVWWDAVHPSTAMYRVLGRHVMEKLFSSCPSCCRK